MSKGQNVERINRPRTKCRKDKISKRQNVEGQNVENKFDWIRQNVEETKFWKDKMSKWKNVEGTKCRNKKTLKECKIAGSVTKCQKTICGRKKMSKDKMLIGKKIAQDKIFLLLSFFFKLLFAFDISSLPHFVFWHFLSTFCPWTFWYRIKVAWEKRRRTKCRRTDYRRDKK